MKTKEEMISLSVRRSRTNDPNSNRCWERPDNGTIKIICDAAWCASTKLEGVGVIACDQSGCIRGGWHDKVVWGSVEEIEARTVLEGVRLATTNRWQNVIIESDATSIINHLQGKDFVWRIDYILSNVVILSISFDRIEWMHIPRTANSYADWIAKQALRQLCPSDWVSLLWIVV